MQVQLVADQFDDRLEYDGERVARQNLVQQAGHTAHPRSLIASSATSASGIDLCSTASAPRRSASCCISDEPYAVSMMTRVWGQHSRTIDTRSRPSEP